MRTLDVACEAPIPAWLRRDVESRLVFIDEDVIGARVVDDGRTMLLTLRPSADDGRRATITDRAIRLLGSMTNAVEPRVRRVEEQRTSPPGCACDVDDLLSDSHELHEETRGVAVLGPKLALLVNTLDARLAELARQVGAAPYHFPALIDSA